MSKLKIPMPPGFVVAANASKSFTIDRYSLSDDLKMEIRTQIRGIEKEMGRCFNSMHTLHRDSACKTTFPLLLSIRQSPVVPQPCISTSLNIGLNQSVVDTMIRMTNRPLFVMDTWRKSCYCCIHLC